MIEKLPEALRRHADLIARSDDPDTATALRWAANEIERLKAWVSDLQSGLYVNCVYCGHRYGPGETTPVSMADALKAHVEKCPEHPMSKLKNNIFEALEIANQYGGTDGGHHKMWVIDQMVRKLTGDDYSVWVAKHKEGEDGPETYEWDEGIPP